MSKPLTIAEGMVPQITFVLSDSDGNVLDRSGGKPLSYLHGHGTLLGDLEEVLVGKQVGDHVDYVVDPVQAFGEVTGHRLRLRKRAFPGEPPAVGQSFELPLPDGTKKPVWVLDDKGAYLTVTPDHPRAGQPLYLSVDVVGLRQATAEEIDHGHAHGDGGSPAS